MRFKKEKRMGGYAAFQEGSFDEEAESSLKSKQSKGIHIPRKPIFKKKVIKRNLKLKRNPEMKCTLKTNIRKTNIERRIQKM